MHARAAVVEAKSQAFVFRDLELEEPRADEVLVRIVATGICQTDVHVADQDYPVPLPAVLGHEGAGIVERVGEGVKTVSPGDHVILSYPSCRACRACLEGHTPYCERGYDLCFGGSRLDGSNALAWPDGHDRPDQPLHGHFFGQSSFATYAVVDDSSVVKVPDDLPLEVLAPFGCGFQTGAGAVLTALNVKAGRSIAVLGTGAVGLAAVMAAKIANAGTIIAVDIVAARLELARELGATHVIDAKESDVAAELARIAPGGIDYVLEITAKPEMLKLAVGALAPLGVAALIGGAPAGAEAAIDMTALLNGRTVRGIVQGDCVPQNSIPMLIDFYRRGLFPVDRLLSFYDFEDINQAVADTGEGKAIKAVLRIGKA